MVAVVAVGDACAVYADGADDVDDLPRPNVHASQSCLCEQKARDQSVDRFRALQLRTGMVRVMWVVRVWRVPMWRVPMWRMRMRTVAVTILAPRPAPAKAAAEETPRLYTASTNHTASVATRVVGWTRSTNNLHSAIAVHAIEIDNECPRKKESPH